MWLMGYEMGGRSGNGELDVGSADSGLSVLLEVCERAVEEIGAAVPPVQLRALLVIDRAGSLNLSGLAGLLGASASAASRLCDRMQAAGLVSRDRAVLSTAGDRGGADGVGAAACGVGAGAPAGGAWGFALGDDGAGPCGAGARARGAG